MHVSVVQVRTEVCVYICVCLSFFSYVCVNRYVCEFVFHSVCVCVFICMCQHFSINIKKSENEISFIHLEL